MQSINPNHKLLTNPSMVITVCEIFLVPNSNTAAVLRQKPPPADIAPLAFMAWRRECHSHWMSIYPSHPGFHFTGEAQAAVSWMLLYDGCFVWNSHRFFSFLNWLVSFDLFCILGLNLLWECLFCKCSLPSQWLFLYFVNCLLGCADTSWFAIIPFFAFITSAWCNKALLMQCFPCKPLSSLIVLCLTVPYI